MRIPVLAASLALAGCSGGTTAGGSAFCYSDGPLASNVVLSPATATVGDGGGRVNMSVSFDYKTRSGATIIYTKFRVEDSNGKVVLDAIDEKNLKKSGSYAFSVLVDTQTVQTYTVRVRAVDECYEVSKWAEATFDVMAVAALAGKSGYATVLANDLVYFIGGLDDSGEASDTLLQYDPVTRQATSMAPMPEGRELAAAAASDGIIYVFGGRAYGIEYESTFAYDTTTDTWTAVAPLSQPVAGAAATARDGLIYVAAGHGRYRYDPMLDLWTNDDDMRSAISGEF